MRTLVSRTKCFIRRRSLRLLGLAVRDRDLLHHDVGLGLVARARLDARDLADQRDRFAQAEDGVTPGEVLRRSFRDEELRSVRARPRVRHREQPWLVELQLGRELVLEAVTRVAG